MVLNLNLFCLWNILGVISREKYLLVWVCLAFFFKQHAWNRLEVVDSRRRCLLVRKMAMLQLSLAPTTHFFIRLSIDPLFPSLTIAHNHFFAQSSTRALITHDTLSRTFSVTLSQSYVKYNSHLTHFIAQLPTQLALTLLIFP